MFEEGKEGRREASNLFVAHNFKKKREKRIARSRKIGGNSDGLKIFDRSVCVLPAFLKNTHTKLTSCVYYLFSFSIYPPNEKADI